MMKKPSHRKVNYLAQSDTARIRKIDSIGQPASQHVISGSKQNKAWLFFRAVLPDYYNAQQRGQFQLHHLRVTLTSTNCPAGLELKLKENLVASGFMPSAWHIHTPAYTVCQDYGPTFLNIFQKWYIQLFFKNLKVIK